MYRFDSALASSLDALILRCDARSDEVAAIRMLRRCLPRSARVARTAGGIKVEARHAAALMAENTDIEVRWNETTWRFVTNRQKAQDSYTHVRKTLQELSDSGAIGARQAICDSDGLELLDEHQIINVAAMTTPGGFGLCLFDEQGAGKTVSMIFAYDLLAHRGEADQLLVVAPKSMVPEWSRDFSRFRRGLYRIAVVTGSSADKRAALRSQADVYVTNFETTVSLEANLEALLRSRPDHSILAVDESFFVKSPEARRTQSIRRLREWCSRAFVLCGTPAPNAPHDLVEQFNLVDFGLTFAGVSIPDEREEALPVVRKVIKNRGLVVRNLKTDVLPNLPKRSFHRCYVPLQPRQAELYKILCDSLVTDVEAASEAEFRRHYSTFLARRTALLQVCSNPASVVADYSETPAKTVLLDDLLERRIAVNREKVVLWSFYRGSIDALVERYAGYGAVRYDGTVVEAMERGEAVRRFQEDEDTRLLIANPAAAGAGLTLHRARVAIYESMSNQAAHYLQSLDRIHRRGQDREVEYLILLCEDTVEIKEYERLLGKQEMAGDLLGDYVSTPTTRGSFLSDLTSPQRLGDDVLNEANGPSADVGSLDPR